MDSGTFRRLLTGRSRLWYLKLISGSDFTSHYPHPPDLVVEARVVIWRVISVVWAVRPNVRRQEGVVVSTGGQAQWLVITCEWCMILCDLWLEMSLKEGHQPFILLQFLCYSHDRGNGFPPTPLPDLVGLRKIAFLQHFAVNYRDIEL